MAREDELEVANDGKRPHIQLSPKFQPLPWTWFHQPMPKWPWSVFSRDMFEGLSTVEPKMSPVAGPAGVEDSQREMLLRMLRSASQTTPQESAADPTTHAYGSGAFHMGQPGIPLSPQHGYGMVDAALPTNQYQQVNAALYTDMTGEHASAYMLYPQDGHHQQGYPAQAPQQFEHQPAASRFSNPQGNPRPRSSRRTGDRRARNQPEDGDAQKRHVYRGIGGP